MKNVRRALRKFWIHDKLLKFRTIEDKNSEDHGLRTIILQNIPRGVRTYELANAISKYGAITGIELPKVD